MQRRYFLCLIFASCLIVLYFILTSESNNDNANAYMGSRLDERAIAPMGPNDELKVLPTQLQNSPPSTTAKITSKDRTSTISLLPFLTVLPSTTKAAVASESYPRRQSCKFPILDPFDSSILSYVSHPGPLICPLGPPLFFYVANETLQVDRQLVNIHNAEFEYRTVHRPQGSDHGYEVGEWQLLQIEIEIYSLELANNHSSRVLNSNIRFYNHIEIAGTYSTTSDLTRRENYSDIFASLYLNNTAESLDIPIDSTETDNNDKVIKTEKNLLVTNINKTYDKVKPPFNKPFSSNIDEPRVIPFKPNVVIIGIDSLSRSNFIRNLPQSYKFLTQNLSSINLKGYSKVGDNTFPNIVALLTGLRAFTPDVYPIHYQKDHVDPWPFLFKNFSRAGYRTALVEEQPGIFSYKGQKGFKDPPTDWYFTGFGQRFEDIQRNGSENTSKTVKKTKKETPSKNERNDQAHWYCHNGSPMSAKYFDILYRMLSMSSTGAKCNAQNFSPPSKETSALPCSPPLFALSFFYKLSHDNVNLIEVIDNHFAKFLAKLASLGPVWDNTMLIVLSDHGNRFDNVRSTLIGRIEERMPFVAIKLPKGFKESYSSAYEALINNTNRLSTTFDLYHTLLDVATGRLDEHQRFTPENSAYATHYKQNSSTIPLPEFFQNFKAPGRTEPKLTNKSRRKQYGQSLFTNIPLSRTCADLSIPMHFCVCQQEETLNLTLVKDKQLANGAVNTVVTFINNQLLSLAARISNKSQNLDTRKVGTGNLAHANHYKDKNASSALLAHLPTTSPCNKLSVDQVLSAERYRQNDAVSHNAKWVYNEWVTQASVTGQYEWLRVTFVTKPGKGKLEALVRHRVGVSPTDSETNGKSNNNNTNSVFEVDHESISRINQYGSDGNCISAYDKSLEKFCYCNDKLGG